jgi:hypothetical protein
VLRAFRRRPIHQACEMFHVGTAAASGFGGSHRGGSLPRVFSVR